MLSTNFPKTLVNSNESIFFEAPERLTIDEDAKTRYASSIKLETLIKELQEKGPLVAFGYMGPKCYSADAFQLKDKFANKPIYGWQPGSRSETVEKTYAFVVGARQIEDKQYVYFQLSADFTTDRKTYIRDHRPTMDKRIFVSSHKTFSEHLVDLYPPVSKEKMHPNFISSGSIHCSMSELEYVIKLVSIMPLESILEENESVCKAIGQEIFDKFKERYQGNSLEGKHAAVNVCDALKFCAKDGALRKQYVEYAWDGIGDDNWRWCH